jgi:hypothetical protein
VFALAHAIEISSKLPPAFGRKMPFPALAKQGWSR